MLSEELQASVLGTTSRGVFLRLFSGWVIFLSIESYCGPLTINVGGNDLLPPFETGVPVKVGEGSIYFPGTGNRFRGDQAEIWQAPSLSSEVLPVEQRRNWLVDIIRELSLMQKNSLFADLLPALLDYKRPVIAHSNDLYRVLDGIRKSLLERKMVDFVNAADTVLGLGAGLTPAGDDMIGGIMLALNRWRQVLAADLDLEALNREIINLAYKKTTLLSANLIECACQGQADERLILALDGIMIGKYDLEKCASSLTNWGNTSGMDALAGMALAVSGCPS